MFFFFFGGGGGGGGGAYCSNGTETRLDVAKFDSNSHLTLDVFPLIFLSKIHVGRDILWGERTYFQQFSIIVLTCALCILFLWNLNIPSIIHHLIHLVTWFLNTFCMQNMRILG